MTSLALTPFFQWTARRQGRAAPPEVLCYPAPAPGNHAGEAVFLAVATALLTVTVVVPLTAGLSSAWLRWPVGVVLLFLLPHVVMALISLASGLIAGSRWHRGVVQDWSCLIVMTAYAAWRGTGTGWAALICQGWLIFMAVNAIMALARMVAKRA